LAADGHHQNQRSGDNEAKDMFESEGKKETKALKMLQVNAVDHEGKLNINVKKKGFTPAEAVGVLEVAKQQILMQMGIKPGSNMPGKDKSEK